MRLHTASERKVGVRNKSSRIEIQTADGISEGRVDPWVAAEMVKSGRYRWWDKKCAIRAIPESHASARSAAALGPQDAEALAGLAVMTTRRRERLRGWGFSLEAQ